VPNFYKVLGVASGAEPEQVKAAFRRLAKSSHPDVNAGDAAAETRFKEVNQAYEILTDPERRAGYDLGLEHERAEARRRGRKVMAAAAFIVTVCSGAFYLLPGAGRQVAGRQETVELAKDYRSPAPQPMQEGLRQRTEDLAEAGSQGFTDIITVSKHHEVQAGRKLASAPLPEPGAAPQREDGALVPLELTALAAPKTAVVVAPPSSAADRQAECKRALRAHAKGLQAIEAGHVSAARQFFELAANARLPLSALALAGTYDPEQLAKLKAVGMVPDVGTADGWYEKARTLAAEEALRGAVCKDGEILTMLARPAVKNAADALAQFGADYISGVGLAYVVIKAKDDEHVYRYGDVSRLAAKKDIPVYTLFTCSTRHVFNPQEVEDSAALLTATVVKPGEPRFVELDAKYLSGCNDPLVKSAIPKS